MELLFNTLAFCYTVCDTVQTVKTRYFLGIFYNIFKVSEYFHSKIVRMTKNRAFLSTNCLMVSFCLPPFMQNNQNCYQILFKPSMVLCDQQQILLKAPNFDLSLVSIPYHFETFCSVSMFQFLTTNYCLLRERANCISIRTNHTRINM
jgi:hypothetical protein